jgi:twinkle protein
VYWSDTFNTETYWCETEGCEHHLTEADIKRQLNNLKIDADQLDELDLEKTGYSRIIATTYDIRRNGTRFYFPYYDGGICVEAKVRDYSIPKNGEFHFTWLAKVTTKPLFGMQTCNPGKRKALIITEGEKDAPAARQMKGYDAVSVPTGAKGALGSLKKWFHWLDKYDYIYLCFDNDDEGRNAAQQCADFIGLKAAIVHLPEYTTQRGKTKDAYDYLASGLTREYCDAIGVATPETPTYILTHDKFVGRLTEFLHSPSRRKGFSTGIPELDEIIGGFRLGEISTILASPGRGKSSFGRFVITSLMKQEAKALYISLEELPEVAEGRLLGLVTNFDVLHEGQNLTTQQIADLAEVMRDKIVMADLAGSLDLDLLSKLVYYGVKQHDIKFVLLDHITAAVNADEMVWKAISQMMDKLNQLAQEHKIHICIISHTNRKSRELQRKKEDEQDEIQDDPVPSISDAFGSSGIEQYTHLQLGLRRVDSQGVVKIHVLKNRLWGDLGVVTTVYNEGAYVATKVHKFASRGGRDKVRKQDGSNPVCEVQRPGDSAKRECVRVVQSATDTFQECSVPKDDKNTASTVSDIQPHTGLPSTEQPLGGNQGSDGRGLPAESGTAERMASNSLSTLSDSLWKGVPNHPKTGKNGLRRVGRQPRADLDRGEHDTTGMVRGKDAVTLDDFLNS